MLLNKENTDYTNLFDPFLPAKTLVDSIQVHEVDSSPSSNAGRCTGGLQQTQDICSSPHHQRHPSATNFTCC